MSSDTLEATWSPVCIPTTPPSKPQTQPPKPTIAPSLYHLENDGNSYEMLQKHPCYFTI